MINIYGNGELIELLDKPDKFIKNQKSISYINQKRLMDMLVQKYAPSLPMPAQVLLNFIYARTITFGKTKEYISIRHFRDGVYTSTGHLVSVGTGLSKATIHRHLTTIEDLGYIKRHAQTDSVGDKAPSLFEFNVEFFNKEIIKFMQREEQKMNKPEQPNDRNKQKVKNKGLDKAREKLAKAGAIPCNKVGENTQEVVEETLVKEGGGGSLRERLPSLSSETYITIYKPKGLYSNRNHIESLRTEVREEFSREDFTELFLRILKNNFPSYFTEITNKQKNQIKSIYKKLTTVENLEINSFLTFCIRDWKFVCNKKLFFLETYSKSSLPVSPQPGIILKFIDKFIEAYREEQTRDPEEIEAVYGDRVGYRAKELQNGGYTAEFALKRALAESELGEEQKRASNGHTVAIQKKYELELARLRAEHETQLTLMRNELRKAKEEAEKLEYSAIHNFTLGNMLDPTLE